MTGRCREAGASAERTPSRHRWPLRLALLCLAVVGLLWSGPAAAADLAAAAARLGAAESDAFAEGIKELAGSGDARALVILEALEAGNLRIDSKGIAFVEQRGKLRAPLGGATAPEGSLATPGMNNRVRRALAPALAQLRLASGDRNVRLAAATDLAKRANPDAAGVMRRSVSSERDDEIRGILSLGVAKIDLGSSDERLRLGALSVIADLGNVTFKADLERMIGQKGRVAPGEPSAEVRRAAGAALARIEQRLFFISAVANLFYGISLGSVLLLAALGLAITFGLMRVINMAHGEMLMLGAYATFVVQNFFRSNLPGLFDWYLALAVPAAFVFTMLVGVFLERTVIRFLYGRPLETLLATWGLSLMLIQTVRMTFGAQNVTVANPDWLSGGVELAPTVVLPYSRIAIVVFVVVVVSFVYFLLQKTPLGLHVRAVTQNREMASGMGISARRVDTWTFGLGSGVAGLGGVALSQLGNVGPELGQSYIVDSFMVVVLGGVGNVIGTVAGAMGLGVLNKLLEPLAGAVLGKILVLALLILFIQIRPQGIFALKGRAAET